MKDIKDYLHLYIGCDMGHDEHPAWQPKKLRGITDGWQMFLGFDEDSKPMKSAWKPILRPLSDMTEEEALYIEKEFISFFKKEYAQDADMLQTLSPELCHYLLSRGFDLFGLIEENLAIDKTKTK